MDGANERHSRTFLPFAVCPQLIEFVRLVSALTSGASPEREQPVETVAPIEYVTLRPAHLDQIHDLLARTFWEGINGQ